MFDLLSPGTEAEATAAGQRCMDIPKAGSCRVPLPLKRGGDCLPADLFACAGNMRRLTRLRQVTSTPPPDWGRNPFRQEAAVCLRDGAGLSRQEAMSIWEVVVALMPTMLIVSAGTVLIEHLRVKSEGDRYQYGEYRADEELSHDHGINGNGQSQKPKSRRAHTRWKDWLP